MSWEHIKELREVMTEDYLKFWLNENAFSLQWWLLLGANLLFLVIGYLFIDRKRIFEMFTVMGVVLALTTLLDLVTLHYNLTAYKQSLLPITPSLITSTYVVLPITYCLIYQIFSSWKKYLLVNLILALVYAFVFENLLRWIGAYEYLNWTSIYSFLVFLVIGITTKFIMSKIHLSLENSIKF